MKNKSNKKKKKNIKKWIQFKNKILNKVKTYHNMKNIKKLQKYTQILYLYYYLIKLYTIYRKTCKKEIL